MSHGLVTHAACTYTQAVAPGTVKHICQILCRASSAVLEALIDKWPADMS